MGWVLGCFGCPKLGQNATQSVKRNIWRSDDRSLCRPSLDVDVGGGDGGAGAERDGPPLGRAPLLAADEGEAPPHGGGRVEDEDDVRGLARVRHRQEDVARRRAHPQHVHHRRGARLGHAAPAEVGWLVVRVSANFLL